MGPLSAALPPPAGDLTHRVHEGTGPRPGPQHPPGGVGACCSWLLKEPEDDEARADVQTFALLWAAPPALAYSSPRAGLWLPLFLCLEQGQPWWVLNN